MTIKIIRNKEATPEKWNGFVLSYYTVNGIIAIVIKQRVELKLPC